MPAQKPAGNIDGKAAQSTLRSRCRRAAAAHRLRTRRDARGSTSDRQIIGTVLTGKQGGWGLDYLPFAVRQIGCLRQLRLRARHVALGETTASTVIHAIVRL